MHILSLSLSKTIFHKTKSDQTLNIGGIILSQAIASRLGLSWIIPDRSCEVIPGCPRSAQIVPGRPRPKSYIIYNISGWRSAGGRAAGWAHDSEAVSRYQPFCASKRYRAAISSGAAGRSELAGTGEGLVQTQQKRTESSSRLFSCGRRASVEAGR